MTSSGPTPFAALARAVNQPTGCKLRIVTTACHERYQSNLARTQHDFWLIPSPERKEWVNHYAPMPRNMRMITEPPTACDLLLSNTPAQARGVFAQMSTALRVPHITMNHCMACALPKVPSESEKRAWRMADPSDYRVWITHEQQRDWGYEDDDRSRVILHGVDHNFFRGWNPQAKKVLVVGNDLIRRGQVMGWDLIVESLDGLPVTFVGDTLWPDGRRFSSPAPNLGALLRSYQTHAVFVNTARMSTISTAMLEAMCVGMPVVTCEAPSIRDYFQHEEHLIICKTAKEIRVAVTFLLANEEESMRLGSNARKAIIQQFNLARFIKEWNQLFEEARIK